MLSDRVNFVSSLGAAPLCDMVSSLERSAADRVACAARTRRLIGDCGVDVRAGAMTSAELAIGLEARGEGAMLLLRDCGLSERGETLGTALMK